MPLKQHDVLGGTTRLSLKKNNESIAAREGKKRGEVLMG